MVGDLQADLGINLGKSAQKARHDVIDIHHAANADADLPAYIGCGAGRLLYGRVNQGKSLAEVGIEHLTDVGQTDAVVVPNKQLDAQFPFQQGDLFADRGLGDIKLLRGPGEAEVVCNAEKIADLCQVQWYHLPCKLG